MENKGSSLAAAPQFPAQLEGRATPTRKISLGDLPESRFDAEAARVPRKTRRRHPQAGCPWN